MSALGKTHYEIALKICLNDLCFSRLSSRKCLIFTQKSPRIFLVHLPCVNRDILKGFYSVFKAADEDVQWRDQVLAGERVQRLQPACRHQHGPPLRSAVRHHRVGAVSRPSGDADELPVL